MLSKLLPFLSFLFQTELSETSNPLVSSNFHLPRYILTFRRGSKEQNHMRLFPKIKFI